MNQLKLIPPSVFENYRDLGEPITIEPITMGLLNKTFRVTTTNGRYILQELSPIFSTTVNEDSLAVCEYLEAHGLVTPKPYRAQTGQPYVMIDGRHFRMLRMIEGTAVSTISSLTMASSAGIVVGRFHEALIGFSYEYRSRRHHGGDYAYHRDNLRSALQQHQHHDYFDRATTLAQPMLASMERHIATITTTAQHIHGDPKISNILFDEEDRGICLIDFDTLGCHGWSFEMADALRSWCNPYSEDNLDAHYDLTIAQSAMLGYGSIMRGHYHPSLVDELLHHSQAISLCLAIRYLTDVLNENYFSFDRTRFSRRAEHNWQRAQAMYALYNDGIRKSLQLKKIVRDSLL